MAALPNPLFTRGEKAHVRRRIRHKLKAGARRVLAHAFGIPLSRGLAGGKSSRPAAHRSSRSSPGGSDTSTVRGDVISALRNLGYKKHQAERMVPAVHSGDSFDSLFRRAVQKNPSELIIFGNPAHLYSRQQISTAARSNPSRMKNLIPAAVLQGLGFGAGEFAASSALRHPRHNAGRGYHVEFHGAFRDKADAQAWEKQRPGSFIRNLRFGPGDYRWTVMTPIGKNPGLVDAIRPRDRVTILTQHDQQRTGRAVMRSSAGGWVLNMGGAHGTPGLADERNIVKVKKARGNPASLDRAQDLFEKFHGRGSGGVYETQRSAKLRKDFTILGPLVAIGIHAEKYDQARHSHGRGWEDYKVEHWDRMPHLAFLTGPQVGYVKRILEEPDKYVKECPQLASSPNGRQLYAITPGGADVGLSQFDTDTTKDFVDLGEATFVVYIAKKPDTAVEWVHELGERGGVRPRLMYDRLKRELFFIGGSYRVDGPGILN